ncbi:MAG: hypothetical protein ACXV3S_01550, partial [Kineosporiaceae bacterium]
MSRPEPTWIGAFQQLASPLKGLPRRWSHQQPRRRPTLTTATTTRTDTFVLPTQRNRLDQLRGRLRGAVHESSDPAYHALATPWNLAVPMRPAAVVEARTPGDVVQSVRFAGAHGITVGVQATG